MEPLTKAISFSSTIRLTSERGMCSLLFKVHDLPAVAKFRLIQQPPPIRHCSSLSDQAPRPLIVVCCISPSHARKVACFVSRLSNLFMKNTCNHKRISRACSCVQWFQSCSPLAVGEALILVWTVRVRCSYCSEEVSMREKPMCYHRRYCTPKNQRKTKNLCSCFNPDQNKPWQQELL